MWAQFMGRGLVHPVDNLSPSNGRAIRSCSIRSAKEIVEHKFDLKWLIRELVNSKTYQLPSAGTGEAMPQWFQHARIAAAIGRGADRIVADRDGLRRQRKGMAAKRDKGRIARWANTWCISLALPTPAPATSRAVCTSTCTSTTGRLIQMIGRKGGMAEFIADGKKMDRIERLFLTTLNRRPTAEEVKKFEAFLDGEELAEGCGVALITSSEFRFNH